MSFNLATILTEAMVGPGVHINAIGGDCPGKTELSPLILQRSDVFVEYAPQTRIEGEIQQMGPGERLEAICPALKEASVRPSTGSVGDAYDNAHRVDDGHDFAQDGHPRLAVRRVLLCTAESAVSPR